MHCKETRERKALYKEEVSSKFQNIKTWNMRNRNYFFPAASVHHSYIPLDLTLIFSFDFKNVLPFSLLRKLSVSLILSSDFTSLFSSDLASLLQSWLSPPILSPSPPPISHLFSYLGIIPSSDIIFLSSSNFCSFLFFWSLILLLEPIFSFSINISWIFCTVKYLFVI